MQWMNLCTDIYSQMRREIGTSNIYYQEEIKKKKIHIKSKAIALYNCGYEIFLSIKSIFGFNKRC